MKPKPPLSTKKPNFTPPGQAVARRRRRVRDPVVIVAEDVEDVLKELADTTDALTELTEAAAAPVADLIDVTSQVRIGNPDDEFAPLLRCVCGTAYPRWRMTLSVYQEGSDPMPCCGRRLFFRQHVQVLEVK